MPLGLRDNMGGLEVYYTWARRIVTLGLRYNVDGLEV
jgi:hypothetical protein